MRYKALGIRITNNMFESTEMGVSEIVLFDGTPAAIDYVISAIDRKDIPSLLVCLYGNKRETMMMLIRRLNDYLTETNRFPAHLQGKLLPIYGLSYNGSESRVVLDTVFNAVLDYMGENEKLASITGLNGRPLSVIYPMTFEANDAIIARNETTKPSLVDYDKVDGRSLKIKAYSAQGKLRSYENSSPLIKLSVNQLKTEREKGFIVNR